MITLSQGILQAQKLNTAKVRRLVAYRRRYWDIEAQAFAYEPQWTMIPEKSIRDISKTKEELDAVRLNEFRTGSLTMRVYNGANEWLERAGYGIFKKDATARLGYTAYRTMFKVAAVYQFSDGTESEELRLFTGYVSGISFYSDDKTAQISLDAPHILLDDADAENYSTAISGELLGIGDGVTKEFTTSGKNVGRIKRVTAGGVFKAPGSDYDLSDISVYDTPAKIAFVSAPSTGQAVVADYLCWHTNLQIHEVVNGLLDIAGITDRQGDDVIFPNRVFKKITHAHAEENIRYECDEIPQNANPEWELFEDTGSYTAEIGTYWPAGTGGGSNILTIYTPNYTASTKKWRRTIGAAGNGCVMAFSAISGYANEYAYFALSHGADKAEIRLGYQVGGSGIHCQVLLNGVALWGGGTPANSQYVLYHKPGRVVAFIGGVKAVDYNYTSGAGADPIAEFGCWTTGTPRNAPVYIDYIRVCGEFGDLPALPNLPLLGSKLYTADDLSVDITAFGRLDETVTHYNGTTTSYKTQTSLNNADYTPLETVEEGGRIVTPPFRYLKIELTRRSSDSGQDFPAVAEHSVTYATLTAKLRLVDCSSLTGLDAIGKLAEIASYEFGFDRMGKFFFKSRESGMARLWLWGDDDVYWGDERIFFYDQDIAGMLSTRIAFPHITLTNRDIKEINRVNDGLKNVYNKIISNYGDYSVIADPDTFNMPKPNSQTLYGVKQLTVGGSQFLLEQDADIATGTAHGYYRLYSEPHKEYEFKTRFLPQLEAGDMVRLRYTDKFPDNPKKAWHIGDTAAHIGKTDIHLWGHEGQSAYDIVGKVLEAAHDCVRMESELTVREAA